MNQAQERLLSLLRHDPPVSGKSLKDFDLTAWSTEDWEAVAAEARRHRLGPLLHHRIKLRKPAIVLPPRVSARFRDEYLGRAAAHMRRFHALTPALKALKAAGVPTIVLKGAYLAEAVYANRALRAMSDVDLLIRREDLGNADAALAEAGFKARELHITPPEDMNEFHYWNDAAMAKIEVHWEIAKPDHPFHLDVGLLREAAVPAQIAGEDVLALSPEDLLIHLGLHAAIHRFAHGLRPLCDLAEAVSRLTVDWDLLAKRSQKSGAGRPVRLFLSLAVELLGAAIPPSALNGIDPTPIPAEIWDEAKESVFKVMSDHSKGAAPHPNLVLFVGRKRWRDKLALAARRAFPSRLSIAARYPVRAASPWVYFYYPASLWELFKSNAPGLRSYLFGNKRRSPIDGNAAALMDWMMTREKEGHPAGPP